jgi:hypothetical protein
MRLGRSRCDSIKLDYITLPNCEGTAEAVEVLSALNELQIAKMRFD